MSRRANAQLASDLSHESGTRRIDFEQKKQAARDRDYAAIASGTKTSAQVQAENTFLPPTWKPNWSRMPRL